MNTLRNIISYFRRNKHRLATVALIFGFLVDIVTFRNINLSLALTLLAAHLFIVAFTILVLAIPFEERESFFGKIRAWLPVLQQYSMGNLLSAFLVLYSASGSLQASWPFYVLVATAAVGNETLKLQKYRLPFHTTLLFLNLTLFFALLFPIVLRSISALSFVVALATAAVIFIALRRLLALIAPRVFSENRRRITRGAALVLVTITALYFTNLIPPIPLTLKDAAFYHTVMRTSDAYIAEDESRVFFERYLSLSGTRLTLARGERAYAYTAVFAPAALDAEVVHRWQVWNEARRVWTTRHTVQFPITGGRQGGYRGFSFTENPAPGRWRLSVETEDGRVIGRAYLVVERSPDQVPTKSFEIR
ncbi:MAG: DUF2914 domain-containing protein [Candidatus Paceibacteria bacterium]